MADTPPGVEMTAGSLGQGLSYAIGQCLAARLDGRAYRVYCLLGDGELDEGQVWEAAMCAAHYRLDNLTAIVDRNRIQNDGFGDARHIPPEERPQRPGGWVSQDGYTVNIMSLEPLAEKWRAFGWDVQEVDGHDIAALVRALAAAQAVTGQPSVIIAHTTKGKGVSFMEDNPAFHGKAPTAEQLEQALQELV
ncbi:MAG: transketolase [Dehalococcoidia bacterium]